jgi:hypothetical protein
MLMVEERCGQGAGLIHRERACVKESPSYMLGRMVSRVLDNKRRDSGARYPLRLYIALYMYILVSSLFTIVVLPTTYPSGVPPHNR